MKKSITFTVNRDKQTVLIKTYDGEYRSLMHLLIDNFYINNFGDCGGMGRCGTCLVEIKNADSNLLYHERNESTTLNKHGITNSNLRLACQIEITSKINGAVFSINNEHANST